MQMIVRIFVIGFCVASVAYWFYTISVHGL